MLKAKFFVTAVLVLSVAFFEGMASAEDFTTQISASQSANQGSSISASEAFGKLKSLGASVTSGISSKVAAMASGISHSGSIAASTSDSNSATQGNSVSATNLVNVSAKSDSSTHTSTMYSRTRCTVSKVKDVEERVCETSYLSKDEGQKYF